MLTKQHANTNSQPGTLAAVQTKPQILKKNFINSYATPLVHF
jgi:hypothetical protein